MELTESQKLALEAVKKYGSITKAARELKRDQRSFHRLVNRAKKILAKQGYAPEHDMTKTCPDGYLVSGVSTLYGEDGEIKAQWVKTKAEAQHQIEMMQIAFETLKEDLKPIKPIKRIGHGADDLLNAYILTDYHFGMKAWSEETGADWDAKIAEDLLYRWFSCAMQSSPKANTGLLIQLGDWLHFDGMDAVTPQSGHLLDADTRFQKLVRVTIKVFQRVVEDMLKKYQKVHIIMAEGNHDLSASAWMREMFHALYANEPRVTVDTSPDPYYCFEFGDNSIFAHHGHKRRMGDVDRVFTAKFRDQFGRTKYSHAHLGHLHHIKQDETQLMLLEQHRTLAAPDAYASRGGWISGRSAKVITYHKNFGKVGEIQISPEMVK